MQENEVFSSRLKLAVKDAGGAEFVAAQTGIPRRTLETYLSGQTEPKLSKIIALATCCSVDIQWLMLGVGASTEVSETSSEWADIVLLDSVLSDQRGRALNIDLQETAILELLTRHSLPKTAILTAIKYRIPSLEKYGLDPEQVLALRVAGDAMAPMINNIDTVLVDVQPSVMRADEVSVFRVGDQLLVRRLQFLPNGQAQLTADQPTYAPILFENKEAVESAWIGNVVWVARWLISPV